MAVSMAIGLLFLAGGTASLRRDPLSVACLVMALIPRFPIRATVSRMGFVPFCFHLVSLFSLRLVISKNIYSIFFSEKSTIFCNQTPNLTANLTPTL